MTSDDPDFHPVYLAHGPGNVPVSSWDFTEAVNRMRGPLGTKVVVTIVRDGEKKPFDVTLTRAIVPVNLRAPGARLAGEATP